MAVELLGWHFLGGKPFGESVLIATTVLVVACPCALGIATPLALTFAVSAAGRHGVLVREAGALERIPQVNCIVFDKTGTLTEGRFNVVSAEEDALADVASLEARSEHPIGRAIVDYAESRGIAVSPAASVRIVAGQGITGEVGGRELRVGRADFVGRIATELEAEAASWAQRGMTVVCHGAGGEVKGLIVLGDRMRPGVPELVSRLRQRGLRILLVSGDGEATTRAIAAAAGIDELVAKASPEDKVAQIERLRAEGRHVAMAGDGVNDAPALAAADLGIAMGRGADIAASAADVVLTGRTLEGVELALDIASHAMRAIRQNLFWAFVYNLAGMALAVAGLLNPAVAAGAMALSSLCVIANSMRPDRGTAPSPQH